MRQSAFPRSLREFQQRFSTDAACQEYLYACRWPEGFRCPRCGHFEAYAVAERQLLQCRGCRHQTSVTAGTVMHGSRTSLRDWFWAAYLVTTHTPGFSALQLQRQLSMTRYETSWTLLHKLRRAMVRPERDPIGATVEVDDSYVGGFEPGRRGGRTRESTKAIVVAAVEVRGRSSGRIRLGVVKDLSGPTLVRFVETAVAPGATVFTDGWQGYVPLQANGYDHRPTTQGPPSNAAVLLPRVHRVFSHLKTWLLGTHHGVSRRHLPHYLDEFVFRFNRRRTPMAAFQSLLGLTMLHSSTTYDMLYDAE